MCDAYLGIVPSGIYFYMWNYVASVILLFLYAPDIPTRLDVMAVTMHGQQPFTYLVLGHDVTTCKDRQNT